MLLKKVSNFLQKNKWRALAEKAKDKKKLSGFYNENYKLSVDGENYLFRFPMKSALMMDPRSFKEQDILSLLDGKDIAVPRILYAEADGSFYVEEFIDGFTMENRLPPGAKMPKPYLEQLAHFYHKLAVLKTNDVRPYIDAGAPAQGNARDFFSYIVSFSEDVFKRNSKKHAEQYEFLGLGTEPYAYFKQASKTLTDRPWRLIHADLHRGNIMVDHHKKLWFIDWELGLYGDLLLCIAAHIHRTRYYERERKMLIEDIKQGLPEAFLKNFDKDLEFYLNFEAMKSVITDTYRFPEIFKEERFSAKKEAELCMYYSDNLNKIAPLIGCKTTTPDEALRWFQEWG
ncbi:MAG: hypothetical protein CMH32_08115 [Micavibrio sp.]|nr:hypothetical protein [Micavibrio sp.]